MYVTVVDVLACISSQVYDITFLRWIVDSFKTMLEAISDKTLYSTYCIAEVVSESDSIIPILLACASVTRNTRHSGKDMEHFLGVYRITNAGKCSQR